MKQWRNRYTTRLPPPLYTTCADYKLCNTSARYFVLSNRRLSYYNTRDDYDRRDLKAAIDLEGCTLKLYSADDYELHLITPKNKTRRDAQDGQFEFHLRAPTPYELQEWLRKLRIGAVRAASTPATIRLRWCVCVVCLRFLLLLQPCAQCGLMMLDPASVPCVRLGWDLATERYHQTRS